MKLADFGALTTAEQAVIDGLGTGHVTRLGNGKLPGPDAGENRQVRASLIRWLALGAPGDESVQLHEKGLQIMGALVVSDGQADPVLGEQSTPGLDLQGCRLPHDLALFNCRFQDALVLRGAKLGTLNIHGSFLPGLSADRLVAQGTVFLRGVEAKGEVRLLGAQIGGDLSCIGGRFENAGGDALSADGLETRGDVFLSGVEAKGEVRLLGARIGGNLSCIGGKFENLGGKALNAAGARVTGTFFWREGSHAKVAIDLTAADIGHINDDPTCWPGPGDMLLDRCRYGAFTGQGISAAERIDWLDLQNPAKYGKDFWPQPWEQCAKVLREMGHAEDACSVLVAKEQRQREVGRDRIWKETQGTWRHLKYSWRIFTDSLRWATIAYGLRPLWALWWLVALWVLGTVLFTMAHNNGGFKPNNAFILRSAEWVQCVDGGLKRKDHASTLACYLDQPEAAGYPNFNALLYSLDTLVPVVDLEVQDFWVPDEKAVPLARIYLWVHIAAGWFFALLAVAGFSGLIDTRSTK